MEWAGAGEGADEEIEAVMPVDHAECTPTFTPTGISECAKSLCFMRPGGLEPPAS